LFLRREREVIAGFEREEKCEEVRRSQHHLFIKYFFYSFRHSFSSFDSLENLLEEGEGGRERERDREAWSGESERLIALAKYFNLQDSRSINCVKQYFQMIKISLFRDDGTCEFHL
jgi:hypothetical protein